MAATRIDIRNNANPTTIVMGQSSGAIVSATAVTGDPGTDAAVSLGGTPAARTIEFSIPAGEAATISVGTVVAGPLAVTNSGDSQNAVFNFSIPSGSLPEGTGLVSVTDGVADEPATLQARLAADPINLRTALGAAPSIQTKSTNFTAEVGGRYQVEGTATITDPSTRIDETALAAGDSYEVWIGSGNVTIGGVVYLASRAPIRRRWTGTAWATPLLYSSDAVTFNAGTSFGGLSSWLAGSTFSYASATESDRHLTALGGGAVGVDLFKAATLKGASELCGRVTKIKTVQTDRNNSTTYTTDSDFTVSVQAGKTYRVEFSFYTTATSNGGWKGQFTIPSVPANISAIAQGVGILTQPGGAVVNLRMTTGGVIGDTTLSRSTAATNGTYHGAFEVTIGSVGGNLLFQWAQTTSHADLSSVLANSSVTVIERTP